MRLTRRGLMLSGLALAAAPARAEEALAKQALAEQALPGEFVGQGAARGHALRDRLPPAPTREERCDVAIVGGGIAGLAAAYNLPRDLDLRVLELEDRPGGNSDYGENAVSAYPWAAHYLPIPGPELPEIRRLLGDFGALTGYDAAGRPLYDETMLCADPQERVFANGQWHDGILPAAARGSAGEAQQKRFHDAMAALKRRHGADGRRLFALPVEESSDEMRALDSMTLAAWLDREGYDEPGLRWYLDYACRDDYGTPAAECSAWAGLHYFASRDGEAGNAEPGALLTWPEGNGWLMKRLAAPVRDRIATGAVVFAVTPEDGGVTVDYWHPASGESRRLRARAAVLAVPRFVAARLVRGLPADGFHYAPWAVANITLDRPPAAAAWDNVAFGSRMLGYVVSTHQALRYTPAPAVLTVYWPLTHRPPAEARKEALARPLAEWQALFLSEILTLHPELASMARRCDVRLLGHAMIRPEPGFIWGRARAAAAWARPPLHVAHSDLSGLSLFETAYMSGLRAAGRVEAQLKGAL